jgi:hypothetical protein
MWNSQKRLSPNAFQSSQATSSDFQNQNYLKALGEKVKEADYNVGNAFLQGGELSGAYGTNVGRLKTQKTDAANAFNNFMQETNESVNASKDEIASGLGSSSAYKYARTNIAAPETMKADTSFFTPFAVNGQEVNNMATGTGFKPNNAFSQGTPLEGYLGKSKLGKKDQDFLRNYLLSK